MKLKWIYSIMQKYRLHFNIFALILFFIIMLPNFYWFSVSAPNDILREESVTEILDTIASVSQILMVIALCIFINKDSKRIRMTPLIIASAVSCLLYFTAWIFYYHGIANTVVILALCIFPCLAFLLFAVDRKNFIAVIPIVIFSVCHLLYGVINFILN